MPIIPAVPVGNAWDKPLENHSNKKIQVQMIHFACPFDLLASPTAARQAAHSMRRADADGHGIYPE